MSVTGTISSFFLNIYSIFYKCINGSNELHCFSVSLSEMTSQALEMLFFMIFDNFLVAILNQLKNISLRDNFIYYILQMFYLESQFLYSGLLIIAFVLLFNTHCTVLKS